MQKNQLKISRLFFIFMLGFVFFAHKSFAQNIISIDSLQQVLNTQGDDTLKCKTYTEIYKYHRAKGNFSESKKAAQSALELSVKLDYKKGIADSYNNLGLVEENIGNFVEAKTNYLKSIKIREQIGGTKALAGTYNNLGNVCRYQNDYAEALSYHLQSLKLKEESDDKKGVALSLNNIGLVYKQQKEYQDALKNYFESQNLYSKLNDKNGLAMVHHNIGVVYELINNYPEAIKNSYLALGYNRETENKNWQSSNLLNIGGVYLSQANMAKRGGDSELASQLYNKAMDVLKEADSLIKLTGNKVNSCSALLNTGQVYQGLDKFDTAQKYMEQSLILAKEIKLNSAIRDAYLSLANLDSTKAASTSIPAQDRLNLLQNSYRNFVNAEAINDSIFTEEKTKQLAELKTRYETEKKDKEIALLNTEKNLQQLSLKEQQAALLVSRLQSDKTRSEMELLNQSKALQEMQLTKTQQELVSKMLEAKTQSSQLELEKKDKALKEQQLGKEQLFRNVFLIGSLVLILVAFLFFNRYKLNQKLEHQQNLINQRKHISADLHDDVGSTLSSISIYSEAIKNKLHLNEPEKVMELVHKIGENARETITNLSDIVWTINPVNDSGEIVLGRMESFASSILGSKNMKLEFHCDPVLYKKEFSMELRQNLFLIFKEAINNAAKYSKASIVQVDFYYKNSTIQMKITDNGTGFKPVDSVMNGVGKIDAGSGGNGLKNMQLRANQLNGTLGISSSDKGTSIELEIPSVHQIS